MPMKKITLLCIIFLTSCINPQSYGNKKDIITSWAKSIRDKNPDVKVISASELNTRLQNKDFTMVLVDARSQDEQMTSMIPGAIPKVAFEADKESFKHKLVVTYCTIGGRSSAYSRDLQKAGFETVSLDGGVLAWAHNGFVFDYQGTETKKVKFLNEAWNVLPKGYEGVVP